MSKKRKTGCKKKTGRQIHLTGYHLNVVLEINRKVIDLCNIEDLWVDCLIEVEKDLNDNPVDLDECARKIVESIMDSGSNEEPKFISEDFICERYISENPERIVAVKKSMEFYIIKMQKVIDKALARLKFECKTQIVGSLPFCDFETRRKMVKLCIDNLYSFLDRCKEDLCEYVKCIFQDDAEFYIPLLEQKVVGMTLVEVLKEEDLFETESNSKNTSDKESYGKVNYVDRYTDLNRLAKEKGYELKRTRGDHGIFENSEGNIVVIPQGRRIGKGLSLAIQKSLNN